MQDAATRDVARVWWYMADEDALLGPVSSIRHERRFLY
jgi:hypothetical protein